MALREQRGRSELWLRKSIRLCLPSILPQPLFYNAFPLGFLLPSRVSCPPVTKTPVFPELGSHVIWSSLGYVWPCVRWIKSSLCILKTQESIFFMLVLRDKKKKTNCCILLRGTTTTTQFPPFTKWGPGLKLRSSGLVARTLTSWAIFLAKVTRNF